MSNLHLHVALCSLSIILRTAQGFEVLRALKSCRGFLEVTLALNTISIRLSVRATAMFLPSSYIINCLKFSVLITSPTTSLFRNAGR